MDARIVTVSLLGNNSAMFTGFANSITYDYRNIISNR